ncbi:MAG TPA: AMP-binding protein, partial [Acidimicrobiia bacterium]
MTDEGPIRGIAAWAKHEPDRPAFLSGDRVVTYAAFDERSTRAADVLADRGVGAGDRVAIMLPNSVEYFEAWAAATKLEASIVPVNWHLKADELDYLLADSGARALVAHADFADHVAKATTANPDCAVLVVGDGYDELLAAATPAAQRVEVTSLGAPVFYTSGTTGRPKGVVHTTTVAPSATGHMMESQVALWGWTSDDVYILSGPAYHAGPGG